MYYTSMVLYKNESSNTFKQFRPEMCRVLFHVIEFFYFMLLN